MAASRPRPRGTADHVRAGGGAGGRIVRMAAPANDNGPAMARFGRLALRLCVVLAAAAALIALL